MTESTNTKTIALSELTPCPVRVRLHTEDFIDGIAQSLAGSNSSSNNNHRKVPGIVIARLDNNNISNINNNSKTTSYILDGHARVEGCKKAGIKEIEITELLRLKNEAEVVSEHVRRNLTSAINPLKLATAIAFMQQNGIKEPYESLGISPIMKKAIQVIKRWPKDLRVQFSQFIDSQAGKFSDVHIQPHFFVSFAMVTDENVLRDTIIYVMRYLQNLKEASEFILPGPDQIRIMLESRRSLSSTTTASTTTKMTTTIPSNSGNFRTTATTRPVEEETTSAVSIASGSRSSQQSSSSPSSPTRNIIMPVKHKSHIHCAACGAENIIDLKNGHACKVEQVEGIQVIRDGDGLPVYALSKESIKFLNIDEEGAEFRTVISDKKSEIERLIRAAKPTARFVVLYSE